MKTISIFLSFLLLFIFVNAQKTSLKKPATVGLHFFYNDFASVQTITAMGFGTVVKNNLWNSPQNMQGGFGIDFLKGITKRIDVIGTLNANWVDYVLPTNIPFGSNQLLMDINTGVHFKLLDEKRTFNPFLLTKIGYSNYQNLNGFSIHPGAGFQLNFLNEAFVLTTIEYRNALSSQLSNQLYYSVGIATPLKKKIKIKKILPQKEVKTVKEEEQILKIVKKIIVQVKDEATGLPLSMVNIKLENGSGNDISAKSNQNGVGIFNDISSDNYTIRGTFHDIETSVATIAQTEFMTNADSILVTIFHDDPRFTLVGNAIDKSANIPVANTKISVYNSTLGSTAITYSEEKIGEFRIQLESSCDFTIVGKKDNYLSNIENISTKGLSRSTTLYVKIELGIDELKTGSNIILNNIYFETGKSVIDSLSSTDLKKILQFLNDNPLIKLEIQGHTDAIGGVSSNILLSKKRAETIVNFLVQNGMEKARLTGVGFGSSRPIAPNNNVEGRTKNRRVEMKILD